MFRLQYTPTKSGAKPKRHITQLIFRSPGMLGVFRKYLFDRLTAIKPGDSQIKFAGCMEVPARNGIMYYP